MYVILINEWLLVFTVYSQQVNRRDGYRCVVTGMWDGNHVPAGVDQGWITLIGAHILKRAVGVFTMDRVRIFLRLH
jgi:hypothetical protein